MRYLDCFHEATDDEGDFSTNEDPELRPYEKEPKGLIEFRSETLRSVVQIDRPLQSPFWPEMTQPVGTPQSVRQLVETVILESGIHLALTRSAVCPLNLAYMQSASSTGLLSLICSKCHLHVRRHTVLVRSRATACAVIVIVLAAGLSLVALPIFIFAPSSDIPEPYFTYTNSDYAGLFRYDDIGEGVSVNSIGVFFEFPVITDGMASLRLDHVNLSVWIYDVTTDQPNSSLILLSDYGIITASEAVLNYWTYFPHELNAGWWCCGAIWIDLQERTVSSGTSLSMNPNLYIVNRYAPDYEGHQFLIRIDARVAYAALWYQGLIRAPYRTALFNFTLGNKSPIYLNVSTSA